MSKKSTTEDKMSTAPPSKETQTNSSYKVNKFQKIHLWILFFEF